MRLSENQAAIFDWSNRCWLSRIREEAFFLLPPVVGSRLSIDAGCDADLPGAPPWLPPGSSPHPRWWAYSPPATCLRWVRRCGRGARSAPCSWPPRMPMAGAPTDLVVDAPPRTPCACSPLQGGPTERWRFCVLPLAATNSGRLPGPWPLEPATAGNGVASRGSCRPSAGSDSAKTILEHTPPSPPPLSSRYV